MTTEPKYDAFALNIDEMFGPIRKFPFTLGVNRMVVWSAGQPIEDRPCNFELMGAISGDALDIAIQSGDLDRYTKRNFRLSFVSTTNDRIVWSRVSLTEQPTPVALTPEMISMFLVGEQVRKIQIHLNHAGFLIELFGQPKAQPDHAQAQGQTSGQVFHSDESYLPHYEYALQELVTWRQRYNRAEYPEKLLVNTFYSLHTVNFMWPYLIGGFSPVERSKYGHRDIVAAWRSMSDVYNRTKIERTQPVLMSLLAQGSDVGGLSTRSFSALADKAKVSSEALEEMEYTYVHYAMVREYLFRWSACGYIGRDKQQALAAVTGAIVNTDAMIDLQGTQAVLGQIGAGLFMGRHYRSLPLV